MIPERLDIRSGDTLPTLRFAVRAPNGQALPSATGAVARMFARRVGTAPVFQMQGEVELAYVGASLVGTYSPAAEDTLGMGGVQLDAECEIRFANGQTMTVPTSRGGVSRFFRIAITQDLADGEAVPVEPEEPEEILGFVGPWLGAWVS